MYLENILVTTGDRRNEYSSNRYYSIVSSRYHHLGVVMLLEILFVIACPFVFFLILGIFMQD